MSDAGPSDPGLPPLSPAPRLSWASGLAALLGHAAVFALLLWSPGGAAGGKGGLGGTQAVEVVIAGSPGAPAGQTAEGQPAAAVPPPPESLPAPSRPEVSPPAPGLTATAAPPAAETAALPAGPAPSPFAPAPAHAPALESEPLTREIAALAPALAEAAPPDDSPRLFQTEQVPPLKPTEPVALPEPVLAERQPAQTQTATAEASETPEPVAQAEAQSEEAQSEEAESDVAGAAAQGSEQMAALPAGAGAGGDAALASVGQGGDTEAAYLAEVMSWLERHKRYPRSAERRRQQGTVMVAFTVAADGQIAAAELLGPSGYGALDEEAMALLQRASPLPPIPPALGAQRLRLELPVDFSLR